MVFYMDIIKDHPIASPPGNTSSATPRSSEQGGAPSSRISSSAPQRGSTCLKV